MPGFIHTYTRWLHTRWPAGTIEKLPLVREDGSTNVAGLYIVGDLTGIPLLKFAAHSGARAVQVILADASLRKLRPSAESNQEVLDLVIIGAGVSGMAAALEARKVGLSFEILEASEPFSTLVNFPTEKPIYTYPTEMRPAGDLQFQAEVKEPLIEELRAQTLSQGIRPRMVRAERVQRKDNLLEVIIPAEEPLRARRVIVAIGRSGNFRKLGVRGEDLDKVFNRLHDPKDFCDQQVLIVGGGDSALEAAIAIIQCGGRVTLSYRKAEFTRPKPDNLEKLEALVADPTTDVQVEEPSSERVTTAAGGFLGPHRRAGSIRLMMSSRVQRVREREVVLTDAEGRDQVIGNDAVFAMIGREPPLEFFRRSGVKIAGEWSKRRIASLVAFFLFCVVLYNWKSGGVLDHWTRQAGAFPYSLSQWADRFESGSLLGVIGISAQTPSFWYTLAYSLLVVVFGFRRIRRRKTSYVKYQTITLMLIQVLPLFLLPELLLPWLDAHGWLGERFADALFPRVDYGHGREFWRAYGFILAWPLSVYNVFTDQPLGAWLVICFIQTFVIIPGLIYFYGKGAYCGWICPCGAMAETLGDTHRHKMPHGPKWNRLNMVGQALLALAFLLLVLRIAGWIWPDSGALRGVWNYTFTGGLFSWKWIVDVFLAGAVGYGLYFWFSGRFWCRFFCPLAALMHIYARFSRFRILADKKKCISCNVCTSVCHQGIDVMNFANKGLPMADPQCVRCSACVQSCPTGVLEFGQVDNRSGRVVSRDSLVASAVRCAEGNS